MSDAFVTYDENHGVLDVSQPCDGDCCEMCDGPIPPGFTLCYDCDLTLGSGQWYDPTEREYDA